MKIQQSQHLSFTSLSLFVTKPSPHPTGHLLQHPLHCIASLPHCVQASGIYLFLRTTEDNIKLISLLIRDILFKTA